MKHFTKSISIYLLLVIEFILSTSCVEHNNQLQPGNQISLSNSKFEIKVVPETFTMTIKKGDKFERFISFNEQKMEVKNIKADNQHIYWEMPSKTASISLQIYDEYLDVTIASSEPGEFIWPIIDRGEPDAFTIPFHEGKFIPAKDTQWISFLKEVGSFVGTQDLSMQFLGVNHGEFSLVYIIKNVFNNKIYFNESNGSLAINFKHQYPITVNEKNYGFRIYLTDNDPTSIAKTYKKYIEETGQFVSLEDKAKGNTNIRKLYGAPFIYVWADEFLIDQNVKNWKQFKTYFLKELASSTSNPSKSIFELFNAPEAESGSELRKEFEEFKNEEFISRYNKLLWIKSWSEAMLRRDFYNDDAWKGKTLSKAAQAKLKKGISKLNDSEVYQLNKAALSAAYPDILDPVSQWGNGVSTYLLDQFQSAGIKKAWIGLESWLPGEIHPEFVAKANDMGYLIAPYDSYHSIHKPGEERWITAKFQDTTLYYSATIAYEDGSKIAGFLNKGRLLNPTLSMPTVKKRLTGLMSEGIRFNSWFIDCDATGFLYDDFTTGRMTNQSQDLEARLGRMLYIRDTFDLVIGSEDGNDISSRTIAFAHGMTTPVIAWGDPDLRENKDSEYFVGSYFSNIGGVPERYAKQVPMKDIHTYIYFDNRFNVPLFELVYNNSVITSHHWEWGTLKVLPEVQNQELREILYNVPPLYQLDIPTWEKHKEQISNHVKVFSEIHEKAIKLGMTRFDWLTDDRLVQQTIFGDNEIKIIANFGTSPYTFEGKEILPKTLLIWYPQEAISKLYKPL